MSTRATYQINGTTFYVHHDGYPQGAATYFANAANSDSLGGLAEKFIRANYKAEFTTDHEAHGDTEYRYTVNGDQITVEARVDFGETWKIEFSGFLFAFMCENTDDDWSSVNGNLISSDALEDVASKQIQQAIELNATGQVGNARMAANDAARMARTTGNDALVRFADAVVKACEA